MKVIPITELTLPSSVRRYLIRHSIVELTGTVELLRKWQKQELAIPDDIDEAEVNEVLIQLQALLISQGGIESEPEFSPSPMGVLMPKNRSDSEGEN